MKQLLLVTGLAISVSAWAMDETVENSSPPTTDGVIQPVEAAAPISMPDDKPVVGITTFPAPAPEESAEAKLQAMHLKQVSQKVTLFRNTVKNTETKKNLFSRLLTSSQNPIDAELLSEMRRFSEAHPELKETAEVHLLMSQVHQRIGALTDAALDLLLLRAAYPESPFSKDATKRLQAMADDDLSKHSEFLKNIGNKITSLKGEREERVAGLLALLGENIDKNFARPVSDACASFLTGNHSWMQEDLVEHAWARQATLLDARIATYHYDKLLALYPESSLRADSLLAKATIQRKDMRLYPEAATTYNQLISQFPDSAETKLGYEALALMYDEDMQDYPNSIKTYEAIVARYKNEPVVLRALQAMANIQEDKTRQPEQAIDSYLKIAELFKDDAGMEALLAAERLAQFTTRDWQKAIDINHRIIAFAPEHEEAIKAEFKNAEITDERLGDKAAARKLYDTFLSKHSDHSLARDASRRIESIDKELNNASE